MPQKQIHVYFSGTVQGVGFRFTAEDIARGLGVCGWAKNLPDGRVEVLAEADENTLKDFLSQIQRFFDRYLKGTETEWSEATGKFEDFRIAF